ncbi:hypothetical protein PYW07_008114 [Mythimna separata]|uniref:alpha-glucosidase n=1 Tax=Mythimna separata TaxID=271217 RepID=A0AAD7YQS8_MYTSE|nr:hypothetical protein PYW07_008114 [Mythimna separata]
MSEPRKNHLSIDGGQVKEDEHVASYKPIPETDTEFRTSKSNLSKSKEKISPDGAEEKLLPKEEEAKIVTRVDMADAKYVVEDHRNGDAKIELDANKRQFSGLTKEELLKYAEDPFWVNLRWAMFILFWALWLCMLAGAITIIVRAPKCAPPEPKTWFEKGPLVDMEDSDYAAVESSLPLLQSFKVQGVFIDVPTYDIDSSPTAKQSFEAFVSKAKEFGLKVIVDLIPNFVSVEHPWFKLSENRTEGYDNYFVWKEGTDFDEAGKNRKPPNNWVSTLNTSAWTWSETRKAHYLHQFEESQPDLNFNNIEVVKEFDKILQLWMKAGAAGVRYVMTGSVRGVAAGPELQQHRGRQGVRQDPAALDEGWSRRGQFEESQPDLNFNNIEVVKEFDKILQLWMKAGAAGVRLNKVRLALVNSTLKDELADTGRGSDPAADHTFYSYWRHTHTSDQPALFDLLSRWNKVVDDASAEPGTGTSVFTLKEEGGRPELFLLQRNITSLRPRAAQPIYVGEDVTAAATDIEKRLGNWPAVQLVTSPDAEAEFAAFELLLPAAPILNIRQLQKEVNESKEDLSHLVALREDASIQHGHYVLRGVPARNSTANSLLAIARWKTGHTGYLALFNPIDEEQRANMTDVESISSTLTPHYMSHTVRAYTNYSNHNAEPADDLLIPPKSAVVFSYVPITSTEK